MRDQPRSPAARALAAACSLFFAASLPAGAHDTAQGHLTILHEFAGGPDGAQPGGMSAAGGAYFGTLNSGGGAACGGVGCGAVYRMVPPGNDGGGTVLNLIYRFAGGDDGTHPQSPLIVGAGTTLFGTTVAGGHFGFGTVFRLQPGANLQDPWQETILHAFAGDAADGAAPQGNIVLRHDGSLCGTTESGGKGGGGTVYCLLPPAEGKTQWVRQTLHSFDRESGDGYGPLGGLIERADGSLAGTTSFGGAAGQGTVFVLSPQAEGAGWRATILYSFPGGAAGGTPIAGLTPAPDGSMFGSTGYGGDMTCGQGHGCGTIFQLSPSPYNWRVRILHRFSGGLDGNFPNMPLSLRPDGTLMGLTQTGGGTGCGGSGCGTLFLLPGLAAGKPKLRILYRFQNQSDGAFPGGIHPVGASNFAIGTSMAFGCRACQDGGDGVAFSIGW
jgi:uncharacterized repeat protein (TIGR03803 family)